MRAAAVRSSRSGTCRSSGPSARRPGPPTRARSRRRRHGYWRTPCATGCSTPAIGLNELFGAQRGTRRPRNARYGPTSGARGRRCRGQPQLFISQAGATTAQPALVARDRAAATIVRELYLPAPWLHAFGPGGTSVYMRFELRRAVRNLTTTALPLVARLAWSGPGPRRSGCTWTGSTAGRFHEVFGRATFRRSTGLGARPDARGAPTASYARLRLPLNPELELRQRLAPRRTPSSRTRRRASSAMASTPMAAVPPASGSSHRLGQAGRADRVLQDVAPVMAQPARTTSARPPGRRRLRTTSREPAVLERNCTAGGVSCRSVRVH